jgi:hypothetical protein
LGFDEALATAPSRIDSRANGDVLARIRVPRHAEDILADVAEAAAVPLDRLVSVTETKRSQPSGSERDAGVEELARVVELL